MALGRLADGLAPSLRASARYPVHVAWVAALILSGTLQWWLLWNLNEASWTAVRFLFVLAMPGILLARSRVLLGENPSSVPSFRDHFHRSRIQFFSLTLVAGVQAGMLPWVLGQSPWFSFHPIHRLIAIFVPLVIAGLVFKGERIQALLAALFVLLYAYGFLSAPGVSNS